MNETGCRRFQQGQSHDIGEARPRLKKFTLKKNCHNDESGFTLVELLIVVTILPLIVGALSAGLIAVFSLQAGVSNRLSHTADAQVVSGNYAKDIAGAQQVTTQSTSTPECPANAAASGDTQLLGLESNLDTVTGNYQAVISYLSVPVAATSTTPATNSIVRASCTGEGASFTLGSEETLANDVQAAQAVPTVSCVTGETSCTNQSSNWVNAQNVSTISFAVNDPSSNFPYTLVASPVASTSTTNNGSPINSKTSTSCNFATPGSGSLASTLCFIDFSNVTGAALLAATSGGCLEMSVALPTNFTMYFCMQLSGSPILPWYLPTYPEAFLGNTNGGVPFYTGIPGRPALYQRVEGGTTTVTFSNISVVSPLGVPATGWEAVSTDAESTDTNESIVWSSDKPLTVINDGEPGQVQPVGNACQNNGTSDVSTSNFSNTPGLFYVAGSNGDSIECTGGTTETGSTKTGTAMIWAAAPTTFSATLYGGGLEAITFGMLLP